MLLRGEGQPAPEIAAALVFQLGQLMGTIARAATRRHVAVPQAPLPVAETAPDVEAPAPLDADASAPVASRIDAVAVEPQAEREPDARRARLGR